MVDVDPHSALYYPHLDFGSAAWVKGALLYWEGLTRMVAETQPHDDPEIRELVEAGLIGAVSGDPHRDEVVNLFGERLDDLLEQRGCLPDSIPEARGFRGRRDDLIGMAFDEGVRDLEARGHRRAAEVTRSHREQALTLIATVFAQVVAAHRGEAPVTDDPLFAALGLYFDEGKVMFDASRVPAGQAAADLLIPAPSIESLRSLSVAKLLQVRHDLGPCRRSFRRKVEAQARAIASLPGVEAVRDHMAALAAEIRDDLEAQRDALRRAGVTDRWSLLCVTAPASVAVGITISQASTPILGPVGVFGSVALAVTNWFVQRRGGGRNGGGHYMLALEGALGAAPGGLESGLDKLLLSTRGQSR